jgi:signal peptidase
VGFERVGGKYVYLTKGDANQNIDLDKVNENNVVGRVVITVPYLGYLFDFFKTQLGYILLFVVPITIIVYGELLSIKKEFIRMIGERRKSSMIL